MDWLYILVFLFGCGMIAVAVGGLEEHLKNISGSDPWKTSRRKLPLSNMS
jgi:hypothetical protein